MEDYNKIVESLTIKFEKCKNIAVIKPVTIENNYELENTLILINKGEVKFGKEKTTGVKNDIIFVPAGKMMSITYGTGASDSLNKEEFLSNKNDYFNTLTEKVDNDLLHNSFTYVSFSAKAFDSLSFFKSLDIPAFSIGQNEEMQTLIDTILSEYNSNNVGRNKMVALLTEKLVITLFRYIITNGLFVEQLTNNTTYFKDHRLLKIFEYIKNNIDQDLSNKVLAKVANVSEDYVGQYFKMLTDINPQDYIEYQRMEKAVHLLRTSTKSIKEIGKNVGYKDTAYFCRRFKRMFGIPAGKMRRRKESLISV